MALHRDKHVLNRPTLFKWTHNLHQHDSWLQIHFYTQVPSSSWMKYIGLLTTESSRSDMPTRSSAGKVMFIALESKTISKNEEIYRQKDFVDLEVIVWLRHSIVLGPYYGFIQPCIMICAVWLSLFLLCATITHCKYRSHAAGTVLYLQVPSP